ncbi:MAG: N-acetylglucosamine-6-phosphate deacetylase [Planctomycetota bacterium]|jgi:N-acetylglucosamine-6-phosphate deacetylase
MKIPGLIDLQVNGYLGVDFSSGDLTQDDFTRACCEMLQTGITAFLPTMITSPTEVYKRNLPIIAKVLQADQFRGRLLGLHLEGPFISPADGARGAHNPKWIRKPDIDFFQQLIDWSDNTIKLTTIAAEAEGADQLACCATDRGITVSLGHQLATCDDLQKLAQAGARALTHLGNGVPALLPRHKNPIWAALANDSLTAMIITDGHHLPPSLLKTIIRTKTAQRCIVVSDVAPLAGMKPGRYEMMGNKVILEQNGRLYNPIEGYLVGSSATLLKCINHLASLNLATIDELIAMAFYNPLNLIKVDPQEIAGGIAISFDQNKKLFYLEK